jgi:hypothetical protein
MRWLIAVVCCIGLAAAPAAAQKDEILFSFSGVLKIMNDKQITIEPEPGNDMDFVRTRHTRFVDRRSKAIKPKSIRLGDSVTVQAMQKLTGQLVAVTVTLQAHQ